MLKLLKQVRTIEAFIRAFAYFFLQGEMTQGTQIKVILDLPDGFEALFKPYR